MGQFRKCTTRLHFGTTVTCPTYRYRPAVVAQAFATRSALAPGRDYLGIGSGEALNEQAVTGEWGEYEERAERMVEAVSTIRRLCSGDWVRHEGAHFQVRGKLYDPPVQPIPSYIAAAGEKSIAIAAQCGDCLVADVSEGSVRDVFEAEGRKADRNPADVPIMSELFTVVGDQSEAVTGAELWRFQPESWKEHLLYEPDPRKIQDKAQDIPLESVYQNWSIGTDPELHVQAIRKLVEAGATIANVHSVQADQQRSIEFYGREILPRLRR